MSKFYFPHQIKVSVQSTTNGGLPDQSSTKTISVDVQPFRPSSNSPEFGTEAVNRVRIMSLPSNRAYLKKGNLFTWQGDTYALETDAATANDGFGLGYCQSIAVRSEYAASV